MRIVADEVCEFYTLRYQHIRDLLEAQVMHHSSLPDVGFGFTSLVYTCMFASSGNPYKFLSQADLHARLVEYSKLRKQVQCRVF